MRLLPSVDALVGGEAGRDRECLFAELALEGLLPSVDALVPEHGRRVLEHLPTEHAGQRVFLVRHGGKVEVKEKGEGEREKREREREAKGM